MVKKSAPAFEAGSLGEWLEYLGADLSDADWVPMWPPDAFAIAAAFLRRTGGYVDLVNGERAHLPVPPVDAVIAAGKSWRRALDESFGAASTGKRFRHACPQEIRDAWREMRSHVRTPIAEARSFPSLTAAAVTLCTVADTACEGLGVSRAETPFLAMGEFLAEHQHQRRSYCMHIAPAKIAVLGKQHTPQRGCSIRSLTHNLSLYTPTEISAIWPAPLAKTQEEIDVFNVLMLPWPTEVADADFSIRPAAGLHRYFDYKPKPKPKTEVVKRVERAMDHAAQYVDRVHAVVLPELALHYPEYEAVERVVANRRAILVSGVRKDPCDDSQGLPSNTCAIQAYGLIAASDTGKRVTAKELVASRRNRPVLSANHGHGVPRAMRVVLLTGGVPAARYVFRLPG